MQNHSVRQYLSTLSLACLLALGVTHADTEPSLLASETSALALLVDGSLWAYGENPYGQLGTGAVVGRSSPYWSGEWQPPQQVGLSRDWVSISQGDRGRSSFGVKADGSLWAWGIVQLPNSKYRVVTVPVRYGTASDWASIEANGTHAIKRDGSLWALKHPTTHVWLGPDNALQVGTDTDWLKLQSGYDNFFGLKRNGELWAWGTNQQNDIGTNSKAAHPTPVLIMSGVRSISTASNPKVVVKQDGSLWTWAAKTYGGGVGTVEVSPTPVKVGDGYVSAGSLSDNVRAIKTDGTLWGWGLGPIGDGTVTSRLVPTLLEHDTDWRALAQDGGTAFLKRNGTLHELGAEQEIGQLDLKDADIRLEAVVGGTREAPTLHARIAPKAEDIGKTIHLYVGTFSMETLPKHVNWQKVETISEGGQLKPYGGGSLSIHQTLTATDVVETAIWATPNNLSDKQVTQVLIGYGTSEADMLARHQYRTLYTHYCCS